MESRPIFNVYQVLEVHSGDDIVFLVDLGVDGLLKKIRVRLYEVDTPNAYKSKPNTVAGTIRDDVKLKLFSGSVKLEVHFQGRGGWIATVWIYSLGQEPFNLNEHLKSQGYIYKGKSVVVESSEVA